MKNIVVLLIIFNSFCLANEKILEYDVKYSDNNLVFINISKSHHPEVQKKYHIVKAGEELEDISIHSKIELEDLEKINNINRFDNLKPGTVIYLTSKKEGEANEKK